MYTIVHAICGYFVLLLVVRVLSRRPGEQMTMFDFVIVFLIGGVIILATTMDDRSVTNCVFAIMTVGLIHRIVSWLKWRYPKMGAVVDGTAIVLLEQGQWRVEAIRKMRVDENDVMAAARGRGLKTLSQVKYAVLERKGGISIIAAK